ncbi:hypothetical protein RYX36_009403 [Vicia faba]
MSTKVGLEATILTAALAMISMLAMISLGNSGLEFGMGRNGVVGPNNFNMSLPMGFDMGDGVMGTPPPYPGSRTPMGMMGSDAQQERSMLHELAFAAMDELIKMSQPDSALWIKGSDGTKEVLNHDEYARIGSPFNDPKPTGFVTEASRETGQLFISSAALVEIMHEAVCHSTFLILEEITWVDHSQYDESVVHQNFRPLVNSGTAFGAHRWIATLERQCESLAILMSAVPTEDATAISPAGKKSTLKLAQRMSDYFLSGICPSSACKWDVLHMGNMGDHDMKIMSRKHMDGPGECIVLSASTSVWMPVSRQRVFDFLIETRMRGEWDALSNSGTTQEMVHIAKGQALGNSVSILRVSNADGNGNEANMLYLQDSWTDSTGSMIVYSPVSLQSLNMVMGGGDSSFVALLPSGFSILPDGHSNSNNIGGGSSDGSGNFGGDNDNSGCLLSVGVQMLLKNLQAGKMTKETVDTVNTLIAGTIQKVKDALGVA